MMREQFACFSKKREASSYSSKLLSCTMPGLLHADRSAEALKKWLIASITSSRNPRSVRVGARRSELLRSNRVIGKVKCPSDCCQNLMKVDSRQESQHFSIELIHIECCCLTFKEKPIHLFLDPSMRMLYHGIDAFRLHPLARDLGLRSRNGSFAATERAKRWTIPTASSDGVSRAWSTNEAKLSASFFFLGYFGAGPQRSREPHRRRLASSSVCASWKSAPTCRCGAWRGRFKLSVARESFPDSPRFSSC